MEHPEELHWKGLVQDSNAGKHTQEVGTHSSLMALQLLDYQNNIVKTLHANLAKQFSFFFPVFTCH